MALQLNIPAPAPSKKVATYHKITDIHIDTMTGRVTFVLLGWENNDERLTPENPVTIFRYEMSKDGANGDTDLISDEIKAMLTKMYDGIVSSAIWTTDRPRTRSQQVDVVRKVTTYVPVLDTEGNPVLENGFPKRELKEVDQIIQETQEVNIPNMFADAEDV